MGMVCENRMRTITWSNRFTVLDNMEEWVSKHRRKMYIIRGARYMELLTKVQTSNRCVIIFLFYLG